MDRADRAKALSPMPGEHAEQVLSESLGRSTQAVAALKAEGESLPRG
jgi:hypothetical protein